MLRNAISKRKRSISIFAVIILSFCSIPATNAKHASAENKTLHVQQVLDAASEIDKLCIKNKFKYFGNSTTPTYSAGYKNGKRVNCSGFCRWVYARAGVKTGLWYTKYGRVVHGSKLKSVGFKYQNIGGNNGMKINRAISAGYLKAGDIVGYRFCSDNGSVKGKKSIHTELYTGVKRGSKYLFYDYGPSFVKKKTGKHYRRARRIGCIIRYKNMKYSGYSVNTMVTGGGTVSASSVVWYGKSKKIRYKAKSGYKLNGLYVDGKRMNISKHPYSYTFSDIKDNHTLKAVFIGIPMVAADNSSTTNSEQNGLMPGDSGANAARLGKVSIPGSLNVNLALVKRNGVDAVRLKYSASNATDYKVIVIKDGKIIYDRYRSKEYLWIQSPISGSYTSVVTANIHSGGKLISYSGAITNKLVIT